MTVDLPDNDEGQAPAGAQALAVPGAANWWLHLVAWGLFYLTVVIAWGERNSWPSPLILCVLSLPLTTLVAATIFKVQHFGYTLEPEKNQQEQLIAALVLAVGLASGQLLLMSLGLIFLGVAWLRPAAADTDWTEWLKMPVLYLTALPFWLDFEGSRVGFVAVLEDPVSNPVFRLPLGLETTQVQVLAYCSLLGMALFLHGRAFWLALPALPAFLALTCLTPRLVPNWAELNPLVRSAVPWLLGISVLASLLRVARRLEHASLNLVSGQTLRRWFEGRRYPPWLAVLVVAVMQALPLETVRHGSGQIAAYAGTALLLLLLFALRSRTPRGPIHSRSVAMVAGGLALTLLAEFTTNEHLRHVASAFVVIGLLSWHCFWPLRVFMTSASASVVLLAFEPTLALGPLSPTTVLIARLALGYALVLGLAWFLQQPLPPAGATGYSNEGWIPPKRFALILLGLMMLFQTAAAFWPEHEIAIPNPPPSLAKSPESEEPVDSLSGFRAGWFRVATPKGPVQVTMAHPSRSPYLLESPERTLARHGWEVVERVRTPLPHGEATALRVERNGVPATAMWWFELGPKAFANHLYARRVLWSGWHLADRRIRLVRLESTAVRDPRDLVAVAQRENWFRDPRYRELR